MKLRQLELQGAYVIEMEPIADERGFFARVWSRRELAELGLDTAVEQCSLSYNARRGTMRGLHYQVAPHEEAKVVRCIRGAIYDVIVDVREASPTRWRWSALELSDANRLALYVPKGFAHGFQTLSDESEVLYQISEEHHPESSRGLRWDDPALGIDWPAAEVRIVSERDRAFPLIAGVAT